MGEGSPLVSKEFAPVPDQTVAARVGAIKRSMDQFLSAVMDPDNQQVLSDAEVCNFLAGNPQEIASRQYVDTLKRWAEPKDKDWFGYKMAHRPAQVAAAEGLSNELGMSFDPDDILLSRGAHGALGSAMAALLDPGDEVIFISPPWFFYEAAILGAGATPVRSRLIPGGWELDLDGIAAAITPKTRMVLLNTPHNPTGRIFSETELKGLAELLSDASESSGRPIYIVSDEAYSRILFDGNRMVTPATFYPRSVLIHTYSKSALAPGQRVGFAALPPSMPGREEVRIAFMVVGAATGNWLPDAIMQYALPDIEKMSIDLGHLQAKRDRMVDALKGMGYELHRPEATFYLLVRSPIDDSLEFARTLRAGKVLVLPGRSVELPGYFRISLTATDEMIERSLPVFARAMKETG
jgi:aspartate aminotransferase